MKKPLILLFFFLGCFSNTYAQNMTGKELLANAINYHDPHNNWATFKGDLSITLKTPNQKERVSAITLNLPKEYFQLISEKDGVILQQILDKKQCVLKLNGSNTISEADKQKHNLNCDRVSMYKDYYTYLYGLPMKLNDKGTIIAPKTERKTFKGKEYLVLKASYEKEVGEDIWYFYFDPKTYAMKVYQFFHDESKNDGEFILLTGEEEISGIKMPKTRAWYYNKDEEYLGTDILTKASPLKN